GDLLNIYSGNPDLDPRTTNRFVLNYHNFKLTKLRAINASLEYNLKKNDIGYAILIGNPQNTIRPINLGRTTYNVGLRTSFGKEITPRKDYLWLQIDGSRSINYIYVNEIENPLNNSSIRFRPSISFKERGGLRFNIAAGPVFERMDFSQNDDLNFEGMGFEGHGGIFLNL